MAKMCGGRSNISLPNKSPTDRRPVGETIIKIQKTNLITFVLADIVWAVNVERPVRINRHAHLSDVRVEFTSIKPEEEENKKQMSTS